MPYQREGRRDTSPEIQAMLADRWRSIGPAEKAAMVDAMTRDCTILAIAGIKAQVSDATDQTIRRELVARRYGRDLANEVYGPRSRT